MEIIDLFAVTDLDVALVRQAANTLVSTRSYTALIKLVGIFITVDWSLEDYIKSMASSKDWSSAELLVKKLDQLPSKRTYHHCQRSIALCGHHEGSDLWVF